MQSRHDLRSTGLAVACAALSGFATFAHAQSTNSTGGAASTASTDSVALQEVTVTANRYAQDISQVPVSIAAFTASQIEAAGVVAIDDIGSYTPGLNFQRRQSGGGQNTSITIRGINSNTGAGTTGVYIDETPVQIRQQGSAFSVQNNYPDIFDLERVEVLRGPQGTLFGEGSMGGTVRFITPTPSLTAYSAYARSDLAFTANGGPSWALGAAGGGPIIDDVLGFRVSAYIHDDGGFVDRIAQPQLVQQYFLGNDAPPTAVERNSDWAQNYSFRAALLAKIGDNFTINPTFFLEHDFQNSQPQFWPFFSDPDKGQFINPAPFDESHAGQAWLAALKLNYTFHGLSLTSDTSVYGGWEYNRYDQTFQGIAFTPAGPPATLGPLFVLPNDPNFRYRSTDPDNRHSFTQEVRLQSPTEGKLNWVVGFFYSTLDLVAQDFGIDAPADDDALAQYFGFPNAVGLFGVPLFNANYRYPGMYNVNYEVYEQSYDRQYAGFGQVSYKIIDQLTLIAGVRVSNQYYAGTNMTGGQYAGTPNLVGFSSTESEKPVTPRYGIEYHPNDANMLYVTVAKGFRTGGGNPALGPNCAAGLAAIGLTSGPENFKTDQVWSYELGSKSRLFDNRVSIDASVYRIDWTGIQTSQYIPLGCNNTITFNANSALSRGFDLETNARVTRNLTVGLALGYNDAKYNEPLIIGGATLISTGDWLPFAVPWQGNASVNYDFKLLQQDAFMRTDFAYRGAKRTSPGTNPNDALHMPGLTPDPSYSELNARAGVNLSDRLELALFGRNLLNQHPIYISDVSVYPIVKANTERPRTIGIEFTYRR
jgi:outer membrane receptor protein involved in Fe transport